MWPIVCELPSYCLHDLPLPSLLPFVATQVLPETLDMFDYAIALPKGTTQAFNDLLSNAVLVLQEAGTLEQLYSVSPLPPRLCSQSSTFCSEGGKTTGRGSSCPPPFLPKPMGCRLSSMATAAMAAPWMARQTTKPSLLAGATCGDCGEYSTCQWQCSSRQAGKSIGFFEKMLVLPVSGSSWLLDLASGSL